MLSKTAFHWEVSRIQLITPRKSNWDVLSLYRSGWMTVISRIQFRQNCWHIPLSPIQCWSTLSSGRNSLVGLLIAEPTLNPGKGGRGWVKNHFGIVQRLYDVYDWWYFEKWIKLTHVSFAKKSLLLSVLSLWALSVAFGIVASPVRNEGLEFLHCCASNSSIQEIPGWQETAQSVISPRPCFKTFLSLQRSCRRRVDERLTSKMQVYILRGIDVPTVTWVTFMTWTLPRIPPSVALPRAHLTALTLFPWGAST